MSEAKNLWHDDGTPRRSPPACPLCGEDKIKSKFDEASCRGCEWTGTLTKVVEFDLLRRPGARLLDFLETRDIPLGRFALDIGLGNTYAAALANIRRYTHPSPTRLPHSLRWPRTEMVVRWASYLGVDVGSFYRGAKE